MTRILTIVATLVAGLAGLFMSVCGGGFFLTFLYSALRQLFLPGPKFSFVGMLPAIAMAAGFCIGGVFIVRRCVQVIKKWRQ